MAEPFIKRFIDLLKEIRWDEEGDDDYAYWRNARTMADSLERRYKEKRDDGFDIEVTGDDEKDRKILADWIEATVHEHFYLGPKCGRNFSAAIARNLYDSTEGPKMKIRAVLDVIHQEKMAKMEKEWEEKNAREAADSSTS